MLELEQGPTAYEILGVHPSAPSELISACYWAMTSDLQDKRRATEPEADAALHRLTHAYETVSDPVRRAGYNLSVGYTDESLMKRALPRRRSFLLRVFRKNRNGLGWAVDPYEVLGLHPSAPQTSVSIAYPLMQDTYQRLPLASRRRELLLNLLDESNVVLGDPEKRGQLAKVGLAEERELSAVPARDDPPANGLAHPSQPDMAETMAAPPITAPAPVDSLGPPATPLGASNGGPEAVRAGREDGVRTRQAAVSIVASAAAVVGTVARGVLWVVVALAVLAVAAVNAGWVAIRNRIRQSGEERQEAGAVRFDEAGSQQATSDEVFLGRLASTVGKSKTERRSSDETTRP